MVLSIGMVSAAVDFITPTEEDYVNDDVLISWENGTYATSNLMYAEDECDGSLPGTIILSGIVSEGHHDWDISSLSDGDYCIKIAGGTTLHENVSITIDTTAPNITFTNTPYFVIKDNPITITANLTDGNLVDNYTIDFGDSSADVEVNVNNETWSISQSHIYNASRQYTVTITAIDNTGNIAVESELVTVNEAKPDWIISLYADDMMNMFSIPLIPESTDIGDVLKEQVSDNAEKIWSYQKGEWVYNIPTNFGWSTTSTRIQEIVPGYGYIIFMNDDAVVYGSGKELGQDVPPEVTLTTGWNLIGHYGLNDDVNIEEAFFSLELGENNYWNNVLTVDNNGDFVALEDNDNLEPTEAYWLSIKSLNLEEDELRYFTYFPSQECY